MRYGLVAGFDLLCQRLRIRQQERPLLEVERTSVGQTLDEHTP
jgi:hypothetical protein